MSDPVQVIQLEYVDPAIEAAAAVRRRRMVRLLLAALFGCALLGMAVNNRDGFVTPPMWILVVANTTLTLGVLSILTGLIVILGKRSWSLLPGVVLTLAALALSARVIHASGID